ncbi:hypothetical protein AHAT_19130 [Agarivorans sp. Toyoura001]|nr:hypothetical protein AHAT_19130 [Agarivorans sp. Toyoura001]
MKVIDKSSNIHSGNQKYFWGQDVNKTTAKHCTEENACRKKLENTIQKLGLASRISRFSTPLSKRDPSCFNGGSTK